MTDPDLTELDGDVPEDALAQLRAEVDQAAANAGDLMRVLAAEWHGLVAADVPPMHAAFLIGQRYRATS